MILILILSKGVETAYRGLKEIEIEGWDRRQKRKKQSSGSQLLLFKYICGKDWQALLIESWISDSELLLRTANIRKYNYS